MFFKKQQSEKSKAFPVAFPVFNVTNQQKAWSLYLQQEFKSSKMVYIWMKRVKIKQQVCSYNKKKKKFFEHFLKVRLQV